MVAYAQKLENPLLKENLEGVDFASRALPFLIHLLILGGFLTFLVSFILGGIKWINNQGDKNKIEEAQKQLTNGFVGLLIVFSIFAIIKLIGAIFGLEGLEDLQLLIPSL